MLSTLRHGTTLRATSHSASHLGNGFPVGFSLIRSPTGFTLYRKKDSPLAACELLFLTAQQCRYITDAPKSPKPLTSHPMQKRLEEWTAEEVQGWFQKNQYAKYAVHFQELDGKAMASLTEQQFKDIAKNEAIGIVLYNAIQELKAPEEDISALKKLDSWLNIIETVYHRTVRAFRGIKWKDADLLSHSTGFNWEYQHSATILETLKTNLDSHFQCYQKGMRDKQNHPVFLIWAGPGTGKSRLLDEFQGICIKSLPDGSLKDHLSKAYVFKVNLEGGTKPLIPDADGSIEVGTRMLYQLKGNEMPWGAFSSKKENQCDPASVIMELAKGESKTLSEMTVFLLVDGIQQLPHQNGQMDSKMKQAIDSVVSLVDRAQFFCVAAIAGTLYSNVDDILNTSPQLRVRLTPPPLNGHAIIKTTDPFVKFLIDDMGGHGRALEALNELMAKVDIKTCSASAFMIRLLSTLESKYPPLENVANELIPALLAVLCRYELKKKDKIPNMDMTVESLVNLGLFRWEMSKDGGAGTLGCPFILLWFLAKWSKDPILAHYRLDCYDELQNQSNPSRSIGLRCWQHWEETTAYFRILKSHLLAGQTVPLKTLHAGAYLSQKAENQMVTVTKLESLVHASNRFSSNKPERENVIKHELEEVDINECSHFILNAPEASSADGFCGLKLDNGKVVLELHQNKHIKDEVTKELFDEEQKKAGLPSDLFLLFSTGKSTMKGEALKGISGLVCKENFEAYFGPFAARAFQPYKVKLNEATRAQLEALTSIGPATATRILEERQKGPFLSFNDLVKRCQLNQKQQDQMIAEKLNEDEDFKAQ